MKLEGHEGWVHSVSFSPDGKKLLSAGSMNHLAIVWNAESGKELRVLSGHTRWIESAAFSPDGKKVVTGSGDRTVRIWDWERLPPPFAPPPVREF
jgi:WD40 repeat protein